jgi:hypothetical protein
MKNVIICCDVALFTPAEDRSHFKVTYCFHLQSRRISQESARQSLFLVGYLPWTLTTKAVRSSEISAKLIQNYATWGGGVQQFSF